MKGKALNIPNNHVQWANGFKSNMPDWPTARVCANASRMAYLMREVRTVMLSMEAPDARFFETARWKNLINSVQECCDWNDLGIDGDAVSKEREGHPVNILPPQPPVPPFPGLPPPPPKPPGVK